MEKVVEMALSEYEQVAAATKKMEEDIYGALDAIDAYRDVVATLLEAQQASDETNETLVKRYEQFLQRADSMTTQMEDGVVDDLLWCLHRLCAVDLTERNKFV